ncbi:MAG: hypothetical protein WCJ33_00805 [Pseudomonadota bacterium]
MHNLHYIMVKADSAEDAAHNIENAIDNWGDENNWRRIGGIASEDGTDDIENYQEARWALSSLDEEDDVPKEGTYYSRTVAHIKQMITGSINLSNITGKYFDINQAVAAIIGKLKEFNETSENCDRFLLFQMSENLKNLYELSTSRHAMKAGFEISELHAWEFEEVGFTDMSERQEGSKHYIAFLDMHS